MKQYGIIYEKSANGWAAYVPELPGLGVAARTRKHAANLIRKGIKFHLEGQIANEIQEPKAKTQ